MRSLCQRDRDALVAREEHIYSGVLDLSCTHIAQKGLRIGEGGVFEKRQPNICTNAQ